MWTQDLRINRPGVLRPLNFLCGVLFSLCIFYMLRNHFPLNDEWPSSSHRAMSSDPRSASLEEDAICFSNKSSTNIPEAGVDETYSIEEHVKNSTLGFQQVFALSMPERTDRRDRLTLMSIYQDVKITWLDSVIGKDIIEKARPPHFNYGRLGPDELPDGYLGSWRSHVNALHRVVEEGLSSALILEDDADWDVNFKQQLVHFAKFSRNIENDLRGPDDQLSDTTRTHSPYGDHWDLLWMGSCYNPPGEGGAQIFPGEGSGPGHWVWKNKAEGGMACIYGYGISYEGAKKLLGFLLDIDRPVDSGPFNHFCHMRGECIVVWPRIIGQYYTAGLSSANSDNSNRSGIWREKGVSPNIENSAIIEMLDTVGEPWLGHADETKKEELMKDEEKQGAEMDRQRKIFSEQRKESD